MSRCATKLATSLCLLLGCAPATGVTRGPDPSGASDSGAPEDDAEPQSPIAIATMPSTAETGEDALLDGSASSDPSGETLAGYAWSCSDGTEATGALATVRFAAAGEVSCELVVTSQAGLSDVASGALTVTEPPPETWTVMIFMNGDNNLEESAVEDINELEQVGSTADVNLVAQIDRSPRYSREDGDWSGARRYLVQRDDALEAIGTEPAMDLGEVDSGDPQTVVDFVDWAVEAYPADRYALIIWNHGWGWTFTGEASAVKGVSSDDSTGNDISVANGELEQVLIGATDAVGGRLDLFGIDACLMGTWELAHVSAPYADIYVASQDYEELDGWAYETAMADLVADPTMGPAQLGEHIAERFHETGDSTLSVIDLAAMDDLNAAIDALALAAMGSDDPEDLLREASKGALSFEYSNSPDRDLGMLAEALSAEVGEGVISDAAVDTATLLDLAVLSNYTRGRTSEATGLSIYTPTRQLDDAYLDASWAQESHWDELLIQITE